MTSRPFAEKNEDIHRSKPTCPSFLKIHEISQLKNGHFYQPYTEIIKRKCYNDKDDHLEKHAFKEKKPDRGN